MEEFANFFSLFHWFQLRPGPPPAIYWGLAGLYVLALGASAAYYFNIQQRFAGHLFRVAVARRVGLGAGTLSAFGIIFVALRFWEVPYLSLRLWVYIVTIVAVGLGGFLAYYFLRMYPAALQAFDERILKQRYMPKPKAKPAAGTRRRKKRK